MMPRPSGPPGRADSRRSPDSTGRATRTRSRAGRRVAATPAGGMVAQKGKGAVNGRQGTGSSAVVRGVGRGTALACLSVARSGWVKPGLGVLLRPRRSGPGRDGVWRQRAADDHRHPALFRRRLFKRSRRKSSARTPAMSTAPMTVPSVEPEDKKKGVVSTSRPGRHGAGNDSLAGLVLPFGFVIEFASDRQGDLCVPGLTARRAPGDGPPDDRGRARDGGAGGTGLRRPVNTAVGTAVRTRVSTRVVTALRSAVFREALQKPHDARVIGGSSGMGLATARRLPDQGACVAICARPATSPARRSRFRAASRGASGGGRR